MDFNVGDRIHVTIYQEQEVDFYATLSFMGLGNFMMNNCSDKKFEDKWISMPDNIYFGIDECYYYTLATDEKNVRELLIENKKLKKEIEKLEEDNEQLCKLGYEIYKELFKYRRLTDNIRHKYETKHGRYSDLMDLINEMEDK